MFVTIEFDKEKKRWAIEEQMLVGGPLPEDMDAFWDIFLEGAKASKLRWEALDFFQRYQFKLFEEPTPKLLFVGIETRWGEYVAATKDQMVLGNPS